jgi:hypothetical protein
MAVHRTLVAFTLVFALPACQYTPKYVINAPANATTIACSDSMNTACSVPVDIQWKGVQVKPQPDLTLDGATLNITLTASGNSEVGALTVPVGAHVLVVSGDLSGNNTIQNYSATSSFTVGPFVPPPASAGSFGLSAPSTDVLVERGQCASVAVTVNRTAPFAGAVTLSLSSPPTGVTAAAVTVPTGATTGTLSICASAAAKVGKANVTIVGAPPAGTTGVMSIGTPVKLVIGRQQGAFVEASPAPYSSNVPSSVASSAGGFRVDVALGPPAVAEAYRASFFAGTTRIGQDIGFTKGPTSTLGGAGFCANGSALALTRGVVLSGALPGTSAQNTFTLIDLTASNPALMQQPADTTVTSGGQPYTFQPRVFFSPDCTLALLVSANKTGPSKNILRVVNLLNNQPIAAEVPFETNIFSALVRNSAGGAKQEVEVKVDTAVTTAQTIVMPIP